MRIKPTELSRLRERRGHSQTSLARASGVSQQRISDLERAGGSPAVTPPLAKKLADALEVPIEAITDVEAPQLAGDAA